MREGKRYIQEEESQRTKQVLDKLDILDGMDPEELQELVDQAPGKFQKLKTIIIFNLKNKLKNMPFTVIYISQVREKGEEFTRFISENASAMIMMPEVPKESVFKQLSRLNDILDMDQMELTKLAQEHGISDTQLSIHSEKLWKRLGVFYHRDLHCVRGPWFVLVPTTISMPDDIPGYFPVAVPHVKAWDNSARRLADLISSEVLPMARSDYGLSSNLNHSIGAIAYKGLAPVADAYLRFRLSKSAVERYLGLFDCFEVVIKYSYLLTLSKSEKDINMHDIAIEHLSRPSLGTWIHLLREQMNNLDPDVILTDPIANFWQSPINTAPRELIDAVNGAGLAWKGGIPRSHIGWLDWLVWLRNKTKGHGGTSEATVLPIWHDFHVVFLETVVGLKELVLDAYLSVEDKEGNTVNMQGWLRGPYRTSNLGLDLDNLKRDAMNTVLHYGGGDYPLSPLVRFDQNSCLTWNSGGSSKGEYIDYSSGKIQKHSLVDEYSSQDIE